MSLLDLSVAMIIIGLLLTPVAWRMSVNQKASYRDDTVMKIFRIQKAMDDFFWVNLRYPCPANPTLPETDGWYGAEDCPSDPRTAVPQPPIPIVNLDVAPDAVQEMVLRGAVPFSTLKLEKSDIVDAWKRKFDYVVTAEVADPALFSPPGAQDPFTRGLITIRRYLDPNDPPADPMNRCPQTGIDAANFVTVMPQGAASAGVGNPGALYVILSHGADGRGAYNDQGIMQGAACPAGDGAIGDQENCDNDATFIESTCARDESPGATFYDDILTSSSYTVFASGRLWLRNPIRAMNVIGANGNYGIGRAPDDLDMLLQVNGNILTENGDTKTMKFCQNGATTKTLCFEPRIIGGDGITCDSNPDHLGDPTALRGIAFNRPVCAGITATPAAAAAPCASGAVRSISTAWVPTCN